jgi:hypothetical protein
VAGGWIGHAPGELAAYQNAREHGLLRTRMQVMPVIDALASLGTHRDEPARRGLGAGLRTGWGDEWLQLGPVPVAPGAPLGGIQAFAERLTEDGLAYGPEERLTVEQAVRAATEGSSRVTGQQEHKGRLVARQLADMVFLEEHPADVAVEEIGSIPVLATVAGGVFTHRQDDW